MGPVRAPRHRVDAAGPPPENPGGREAPGGQEASAGPEEPAEPVDRVVVPVVDSSRLRLADRYWLDERIDGTETSGLWRGWDELLARPVCVLVLDGCTVGDPALPAALRTELEIASALPHPELAEVYDFGVATGPAQGQAAPYVVMEPLDGETLAVRIERGPLPWREAARICAATAAALARAHAAGIAHRDVRAAHIFLAQGGVRLLGLGLGLGLSPGSGPDPHARAGRPGQGPGRSSLPLAKNGDVRALGAVLLEALTGRRITGPLGDVPLPSELPADVPPRLVALCRRLHPATGPSVFPSACDLAESLTAIFTGTGRGLGLSGRMPLARMSCSGRGTRGRARQASRAPRASTGSLLRAVRGRGRAIGLSALLVSGLLTVTVQRGAPWSAADPAAAPVVPPPGSSARSPAAGAPPLAGGTGGDPQPSADTGGEPSGGPGASGRPGADGADRATETRPPPDTTRPDPDTDAPPDLSNGGGDDGVLTRDEAISRLAWLRRSVEGGVSNGEIRPDVGLDLDNVITNLRNDLESGRVTDPRPGARHLHDKIDTRLREGALTQRRAERLKEILAPLTRG